LLLLLPASGRHYPQVQGAALPIPLPPAGLAE